MVALSVAQLLFNSLALTVALGFLFVLLWQDARREASQSFGVFLIGACIWNSGLFLAELDMRLLPETQFNTTAIIVLEVGYVSVSVGLYVFVTVIAGLHRVRLRFLAAFSVFFIILYRSFLIVIEPGQPLPIEALAQQTRPILFVLFSIYSGMTIYLVWSYRGKIDSGLLASGILLIVTGQGLIFVNSEIASDVLSSGLSAFGIIILGIEMIRQEIVRPFSDRTYQIETIQRVTLAISSRIAIGTVLSEIAVQASDWLDADGTAIYLKADSDLNSPLRIETVHNLPRQLTGMTVALGQGVAGTVAMTRSTILLENYQRDWTGGDDFPMANAILGSVVGVPLIYARDVIGVLLVVAGRQSRRFGKQDAFLLELLAGQAAVAIAHSRLFDQIMEAREQLEAVLSSTESPVIAVDRNMNVIFANSAANRLLQIDNIQSFVVDIPSRYFPSDWKQALRQLRAYGSYVYEIEIDAKYYVCHLTKLGDRRTAGWVAILNNVTELKELDRIKSEMVRMASHDLKNPLMGAMAHLDLLREDIVNAEQGKLMESIRVVEQQLDRMNKIIGGVLDIERIKVATSRGEEVVPEIVVENALGEIRHFAADRGIRLDVYVAENLPSFEGNESQIERMLINLLENAIKFSLDDGKVSVSVQRDDKREQIVFEIADNGVGIPVEMRSRIFDRFYRGEQKGVEHVSGSGLGLSLVKAIVEQHGGEIWLESEVNRGTKFFVSVPALKA